MERMIRGGVARLSQRIERDLRIRDTGLQVPHIKGLSDFTASVLHCRSVNTSEIAAVVPRAVSQDDSRYRMLNRWLKNPLIDPLRTMCGFIPELIEQACRGGKTAVLMLDQSKVGDGFECLMLSLRLGERAIPLAWHVTETQGNIGFKDQKPLLDNVLAVIPADCQLMLTADRFYGTSRLIGWCQAAGWAYRLRLKSNLILEHEGAELVTGDIARLIPEGIKEARLNGSSCVTSIGVLHEKGHKEPWIIAMDGVPTVARVRDYGMRWGIEALFSDFKSRGFGITQTKLRHAERIARLILVLTMATYFAVSTAMKPDPETPKYTLKKPIAA